MNIADKQKLYSEMFRVLKPMGTLVIYDIFKGPRKNIMILVLTIQYHGQVILQ